MRRDRGAAGLRDAVLEQDLAAAARLEPIRARERLHDLARGAPVFEKADIARQRRRIGLARHEDAVEVGHEADRVDDRLDHRRGVHASILVRRDDRP